MWSDWIRFKSNGNEKTEKMRQRETCVHTNDTDNTCVSLQQFQEAFECKEDAIGNLRHKESSNDIFDCQKLYVKYPILIAAKR